KNAEAHRNLGNALCQKGQLGEAIAVYRKVIELDPKDDVARTELAQVQRLTAVEDRLVDYMKGDFKPTTDDERLALLELSKIKRLYRTLASLSADAFAADPKLADDLQSGRRYNAACYASLAAAGQGEDAAKIDGAERARLSKQALDWLRADLALLAKQLRTSRPADRAAAQQAL